MPQLPATAFSTGFASLSRVHVAATRLLVWFSFHSDCHSHSIQLIYSCFTLQYPQILHFCPKELSHVQIWPQLHFSHPQLQIQSYSLSSFYPPSFVLPRFVWFYVFFSRGQVLLPILSWSSARSSVSGGIFLLYTWREMHSMSTYSSTILDLRCFFFFQLSCMKLYILEINL